MQSQDQTVGERPLTFEGIKVAEFAWMGVGPLSTTYLGNFGATVVRIESHTRPDGCRFVTPYKDKIPGLDRSGYFANFNSSKYGVSLDFSKSRGRELALKFVRWADIVVESFTPGKIKKWGLDYESARKVKPDIIYCSTSQQGQSGPRATFSGYGQHAIAMAGLAELCGWPDRDPAPPLAYSDFLNPPLLAATLIAALDYRRRTGRGLYIDQSQLETSVQFLAPVVMDYVVNGCIAKRNGNRLPSAAPHGVYPCAEEDRWVAIGVFTDGEWQAFCKVIGEPEWTHDPKFATLRERKKNEDELERLVSEWTKRYTAKQVEAMMQGVGVPANAVETNPDLFNNAQLKHREHFKWLFHSVMGVCAYEAPTFRLSKASCCMFAAPCLGEHNEYVYKELLGLSDEEIAELLIERVITTDADLPL